MKNLITGLLIGICIGLLATIHYLQSNQAQIIRILNQQQRTVQPFIPSERREERAE